MIREQNQLEQALYGSAVWIFDAVLALRPDPAEGDLRSGAEAEISFRGPLHGRLRLRLSRELLPVVAARMLGEESPPDAAIQLDALGEMANLICGHVLPRIAPEAVFEMSPPRVREGEPSAEEAAAVARLGLPEGRMDVSVVLEA